MSRPGVHTNADLGAGSARAPEGVMTEDRSAQVKIVT
jgi:hypothetical protein